MAGIDKGREPWISDEGGQVTLREKEKFMARITYVSCLAIKIQCSEKEETPPKVGYIYHSYCKHVFVYCSCIDPLGRIYLV